MYLSTVVFPSVFYCYFNHDIVIQIKTCSEVYHRTAVFLIAITSHMNSFDLDLH